MNVDIRSPQFWENQWNAHIAGDTAAMSKGYSTPEFWDGRAEEYYQGHEEESKQEAEQTVDLFEQRGCVFDRARVLDIGCGPGTLSFSLAARGAVVTALDFSPGMLKRLTDEMPSGLERNITVVQASWDEVDLARRGWECGFDLVLSNMSPAIHDAVSLNKMISASNKSCYLKAWETKKRHSEVQEHIWELLTGAKLEDRHAPFPYMINYLLARGFYPDLTHHTIEWTTSETLGKAIAEHVQYFSSVLGKTEENITEKITGYLESAARNGILEETITGRTGSLFWNVT